MLTIAGHTFTSRLFLGTGKFSSSAVMQQAIEASGTEMVTVALRRIDLDNPEDDIMSALDRDSAVFLAQHLRGPERRRGHPPGPSGPGGIRFRAGSSLR